MVEPIQQPTPEFFSLACDALRKAGQLADHDAYDYMSRHIPVYAQWDADTAQKRAGGCPDCMYLGLWADKWDGVEVSTHGVIFCFEQGIRTEAERKGVPVEQQVKETILHEFGHALQFDHVLDAMEAEKAAAMAIPLASRRP